MKDNFITIKSLPSEMEAQLLRGKLRAYGIESLISKDDCGGVDPMMHMAFDVHIKVREKDSKEALSIIEDTDNRGKIANNESSKSLTPFWILMFLSFGTGLYLSGHAYYRFLTKYGVILILIGASLWLWTKIKQRKSRKT